HVFLLRGGGDHFGRLPQAGVNHFHPGVAQGPGDDPHAAVVPVQPRLRHQHAYLLLRHSSLCSLCPCDVCVSLSIFRRLKDISPYSFFQDWDVEIDEEAKPTVSQEKTRQRDGPVDGSRSAASGRRALTDSASCPWSSRDGDFFVGAKDRAHGVADLAQR